MKRINVRWEHVVVVGGTLILLLGYLISRPTTVMVPAETAVPVMTPACAACPACAAPIEIMVTPTPAAVLPTPLPPASPEPEIDNTPMSDVEIIQVLWENDRVRREGAGEEGDVELRFDPQPELPWWTQLADDRKILQALRTTDPQDGGQVVVVLEEKSNIAWIIKRADPGRYQVFPWQLWNVPGEILDLSVLPDSVDGEFGVFIVYTVEGMDLPLYREIKFFFPLG